jgi:hypothetical protein
MKIRSDDDFRIGGHDTLAEISSIVMHPLLSRIASVI